MFSIDVNTQDRKCRDLIPIVQYSTVQYSTVQYIVHIQSVSQYDTSTGHQSADCVTSYTQPAAGPVTLTKN